jgi:hypothetical protein
MTDDISPLTLKKLLEEHALVKDPVYFYQRYMSGRPVKAESRKIIREAQRIDKILETWKKAGRL